MRYIDGVAFKGNILRDAQFGTVSLSTFNTTCHDYGFTSSAPPNLPRPFQQLFHNLFFTGLAASSQNSYG